MAVYIYLNMKQHANLFQLLFIAHITNTQNI